MSYITLALAALLALFVAPPTCSAQNAAAKSGAPLLALHSWDIHPSVGLSADDRAAWGKDVQRSVATTIAPWQRRHR